TGSSANANTDLTIASVSGNVVTFAATDTIVAEAGRSVTILPVVQDPIFTPSGAPANISVTFQDGGYDSTGNPLGGTITRTAGSWLVDGYLIGSLVRISGDSVNATDDTEVYTVASVT